MWMWVDFGEEKWKFIDCIYHHCKLTSLSAWVILFLYWLSNLSACDSARALASSRSCKWLSLDWKRKRNRCNLLSQHVMKFRIIIIFMLVYNIIGIIIIVMITHFSLSLFAVYAHKHSWFQKLAHHVSKIQQW